MKERKNPQAEAFYESRELINQAKNLRQLTKAVERAIALSKEHKFDETQVDLLEKIGMNKYERIQRDLSFMMKNKKFGN